MHHARHSAADGDDHDDGKQQEESGFHGWEFAVFCGIGELKSSLAESCGEGAVCAVIDRDDLDVFFHTQAVFFCEGGDEFDVLCGFDGAGRVNDAPAGLEAGEGVAENFFLDLDEMIDFSGLQSPTDINAAANHAGV